MKARRSVWSVYGAQKRIRIQATFYGRAAHGGVGALSSGSWLARVAQTGKQQHAERGCVMVSEGDGCAWVEVSVKGYVVEEGSQERQEFAARYESHDPTAVRRIAEVIHEQGGAGTAPPLKGDGSPCEEKPRALGVCACT